MQPSLRLSQITKRFGALLANDAISLQLERGEVLGLLGENGAGKSTLMSILFGHYLADSGHIEVFGQPVKPGDPKAALAAGIGMVHQHFTLADNLSVLDNVMLGTEPLWQPFSRKGAARARLLSVAKQFGLALEPDALVGNLSVGERQRVEIIKALYRGAKILILDEPTAVLTPQESEALFGTLQLLVAQGLSVIFISHKLDEVLRVCQRVVVLRAGRLVAQASTRETHAAQLAQWMVGHAVDSGLPAPAANVRGELVCELQGVCVQTSSRHRIKDVNLSLYAGELVAIAGVAGNGQNTLADVLCGIATAQSGRMSISGRAWPTGPLAPQQLTDLGVARIAQDRRGVGLVGDLALWENAVSERLHTRVFSHLGWVKRRRALAHAQQIVQRFDVRGAGLRTPAKQLSGGNMQKLLLGRALLHPLGGWPRLIVAHQPTWGLDIGAVAAVHAQLLAARNAGAAVLLISEDLDEVMRLADRTAVMHANRLSPVRAAQDWTRDSLGLAMAGADRFSDDDPGQTSS